MLLVPLFPRFSGYEVHFSLFLADPGDVEGSRLGSVSRFDPAVTGGFQGDGPCGRLARPPGKYDLNLGGTPKGSSVAYFAMIFFAVIFYAVMLEFAVFRHLSRHPPAAAAGLSRKERAWDWTQGQIREGDRRTERFRENLISEIGIAFPPLFHRIGDCRIPTKCP